MIEKVARLLPQKVIRFAGQLQFKLPWLRGPINFIARRITSRPGVIGKGIGEGLKFDPAGGYPGYLLGTSETDEQYLLARLLPAGGVFYDLGANIGFYSTLAGRLVGPEGQVYAFEPFPASAAACRRNAQLNGFANISVCEAAVGAADGSLQIVLGDSSATHRLSDTGDEEVQVISLDSWQKATGNRPPDVVMIDIEGAELDALEGMQELIRTARPALMIEVHWLGERFCEYFRRELEPFGYRATTYDGQPLPAGPVRYHAVLIPTDATTHA